MTLTELPLMLSEYNFTGVEQLMGIVMGHVLQVQSVVVKGVLAQENVQVDSECAVFSC